MRSLRTRTAALVVALALIAAGPATSMEVSAAPPPAVAAKSCPPGYTHAALSWGHKCLRAGQYCKKGANREYHRYDYHCGRDGRLRDY